MSSASSSARRSTRRGIGRVEHTSTSADRHAGEREASQGLESGLDSGRCARTARDDWLEVDDCVGERGAVERLASYFERGKEEGPCHLRFVREAVQRLKF